MNSEYPKKEKVKKEETKYCALCEKEITLGKEIKVIDYLHHPSYLNRGYGCS